MKTDNLLSERSVESKELELDRKDFLCNFEALWMTASGIKNWHMLLKSIDETRVKLL